MDAIKFILKTREWLINTDEPEIRTCWNCDNTDASEKLLLCGGCSTVYYCSITCQHHNWPFHRKFCKIMRKYTQLYNKIENFVDSLTSNDIPKLGVCYILQIKNSFKFSMLIDARLNLATIPLIIKCSEGNIHTTNKDVYSLIVCDSVNKFIDNYGLILYKVGAADDVMASEQVLEEQVKQRILILVLYAKDLGHYSTFIVDK